MAKSGSVSGEVSPQVTPTKTGALRRSPDAGETESSADEETSIMRKSRRQNINYQGTAKTQVESQKPSVKSKPSTTITTRTGRVYDPNENGRTRETDVDEHESWWASVLSNYGSIELENKGSVARDHLALGLPSFLSLVVRRVKSCANMFLNHRAYLSSLAPNLPRLRINWHSYNATLPSQYCLCCRRWQRSLPKSQTNGQAYRRNLPRHKHCDTGCWLSQVF